MRCFIKTEKFTKKTLELSTERKKKILSMHKKWLMKLKNSGIDVSSGFLVDKYTNPGGGGLLIIKASSYEKAIEIIKQDPMIQNNLVIWELNEWIEV